MSHVPHVVIIGGGFGGLAAVKRLRKLPLDISVVDRRNYHLFQPLLYRVATAALSPADIAQPIRRILRGYKNVAVVLAEVEDIDLSRNELVGLRTRRQFDYLVIAIGSTHSFMGHDEWAKFAPGLKTIEDATEIRRRILLAFEAAEYEGDEAARRAKLTFVVVGGGATGVEMAGALREIAGDGLPKDFHNIDTKTCRVILLQGGDRLLPAFPEKLSLRAQKDLEEMGVEVRLRARVTAMDEHGLWIGEERLDAANILWAAGVEAPPLLKRLGVPLDKSGRVIVESDLSVPGHPNVFVIGDAASAKHPGTGAPVPGLAPAAIQMGNFVASIIAKEVTGRAPEDRPAFRYWNKGTMATIGTHRAVADVGGMRFGGFFAWFLWAGIHVMFLVNFRSKLAAMASWFYEFWTKNREVRLITGDSHINVTTLRRPPGEEEQGPADKTVA